MKNMKLSSDQIKVVDRLEKFINDDNENYITIEGKAGTGKTFIICEFFKERDLDVIFSAFTNKAVTQLSNNLPERYRPITYLEL